MKLQLSIISAIAASACAASAANVIAWNFAENWGPKTVQGEGFAFGTDQWTDSVDVSTAPSGYRPANSTDDHAVTTPINAAGVSVNWTSGGGYQAGDENTINENQVFRLYLDDGGAGPMVIVSGLAGWASSGYKVTFYQNSDNAGNTFAEMNLYDGSGTGGTLLEKMDPQLTDGSGSGDGARLIRSAAGTFTSDTITFHTDRDLGVGGERAGISGFTITSVPEPSSSALLGLGGLALLLRRRK